MSRRPSATEALCFLSLLLLPEHVHGLCRVRLDIEPDDSSFRLTGTNTIISPIANQPPIEGNIREVSSVTKGLAGAIYGSSSALPSCPTTNAADWLTALPSFTFSSSVPFYYSSISLWPPILNATTAGFPYEPRNLELEVNATVTGSNPAQGTFQVNMATKILRGWLFSSTPLTSTRWDNLANLTASGTQTGVLTVQTIQGYPTLSLQIPNMTLTISTGAAATQFQGNTLVYTTISNITINGQLMMKTVLSCPGYCGDRGRCVAGSGGARAGCQCECGWSLSADGMCTEPRGHCDQFPGGGSNSSSVVVVYQPSAPSQCTVTAPQNALVGDTDTRPLVIPLDSLGNCQSGYSLNPSATGCARCSIGFSGLGCGTCQSDELCKVATRSNGATCWRNATYGARSAGKNYTCTTVDENVRGLLGDTVGFMCSTVPPANSTALPSIAALVGSRLSPVAMVVGTTPFCSMTFRMPTFMPGSYAVCSGWDCTFGRDSSRVSCSVVTCDCPQGCMTRTGEDMAPTFKGTTGAIALSCDPSTGPGEPQDCKVELTGLPIGSVRTRCQASECYDPNFKKELDFVVEDNSTNKHRVSNPVIAVLPLLVLVALFAGAVVLVGRVRPFITGTPHGTGSVTIINQPAGARQPVAEGVELVQAGADANHTGFDDTANGVTEGTIVGPITVNGAGAHQGGASSSSGPSSQEQAEGAQVAVDPKALTLQMGQPALHFRFMNIHASAKTGGWMRSAGMSGCVGNAGAGKAAAGYLHILHGVSGTACEGELVGILGPSGSGKSTLLNVLSGQVQNGGAWNISGDISLGGQPLAADQLCHVTACVPQHDLLLRFLTVEECLRSSAALRLGPDASPGQVWARADKVLRELNMSDIRNSRCYKGNRALLSGGERQRVSIGMELVTDPKILMLDEPTSGLDSYNALQVLMTIQSIASGGRIVITSLHQPSPVLYNMLSRAMLIARGHLVFLGPPSAALAAFDKLGAPCPRTDFIAEHMLRVVGSPDHINSLMSTVTSAPYQASLNEAVLHLTSDSEQDPSTPSSTTNVTPINLKPPRRSMRHLGVLLWRTFADVSRNPMLAAMHLVFAMCLGVICGAVYFKIENNTAGAQNRVGSLFFILNLMAFLGITSMDMLQSERLVSEREMIRRYYHPALYLAQKVLVDSTILRVIPALVFGTIFYWMAGFRSDASAFLVFIFVFCVWHCVTGTMALICCSLISSPGRASLVFTVCLLLSILFAGFLVNRDSISWVLRWLCYVSPMRYTWEVLSVNELKPMVLTLNAPGLPPVPPVQGSLFLGLLGVDPDDLVQNLIIIDCFYAGLVLLSLFAMLARMKLIQKGWA